MASWCLALVLVAAVWADRNLEEAVDHIPSYEVDLGKPASERWVHVFREWAWAMPKYVDYYVGGIEERIQQLFDRQTLDAWVEAARAALGPEYEAELQSMVDVVQNDKVTLDRLVLLSAMYEMGTEHACSSLLAAKPDGTVIHGRNLDASLINPVVDVAFIREGKSVFRAPMYLSGALHTAMRVGNFTVAHNGRRYDDESEKDYIAKNLEALQSGSGLHGAELRRLLERQDNVSFKTAVQALATANFAAPQYFVLAGAGPYEGADIRVDRRQGRNRPYLNVDGLQAQFGRWYLVQTNDDLQVPAKSKRLMKEHQELVNHNQYEVSEQWVYNAMMTKPLHLNTTLFSWVANVNEGTTKITMGPANVAPPQAAAMALTGERKLKTRRSAAAAMLFAADGDTKLAASGEEGDLVF